MSELILTISELTSDIKLILEEGFASVKVEGEISNYKHHSSGHKYFSLKDESASISCVMWKSKLINFKPKNGDKVTVSGRITVYPQRGNYQLDVNSIKQKGIGDLFLEFEKLKKKLDNKGYFDAEYKKPLPVFPMKIGVATSPTGAAIQDIISTLKRRLASAQIYLRPTIVQGNNAGNDIAKAIKDLEKHKPDLIIIGRGGGSLEDLWGFNEEVVADAIFKCKIPIISAVGHETDFSISDFVADYRAATPTTGAEIASPKTLDFLLDGLSDYQNFMKTHLLSQIDAHKEKINLLLTQRTQNLINSNINQNMQTLDDFDNRMKRQLSFSLSAKKQKVNSYIANIKNLDPKLPLAKGYAIIKSNGKTINNNESLKNHKNIEIIRQDETAYATVKKLLPKELF